MKLGLALFPLILAASIPLTLALTDCGPLVNDRLPDAGASSSGTSGGAGGSGTASGTTAPDEGGAASGSSGDTAGSAASGSSTGSAASGDSDATAPATDTGGASGSSSSGSTSGGMDATSSGGNLVTNGNFAQGGADWGVSSGPGMIAANNNELCVSATSAGTSVLGWPQAPATSPALSSGTSYVFSYSARTTTGTVTIEAKVANSTAAANYMPVDSDSMDPVTTTLASFTHAFTPTTADPSAGIAFIFGSTTTQSVCVQNVSLVAQ